MRNRPVFVKEIVDEIKYLGVILKPNGRFISTIKLLFEQARKAMHGIISKARSTDMPTDFQFKLFDSLVLPFTTYVCEIWGHENFALLEKLHLKFCKIALKIRTSTPGYMVYGELGRYPLRIIIMKGMIGYWCTILLSKQKRLTNQLYR